MSSKLPYDSSTAQGQIRLFYESVGLWRPEFASPLPRMAPAQAPSVTRNIDAEHELVGRQVRALWKPGRFDAVTEGVILKVDPVAASSSLRLVIQRADGSTQRAYTEDSDWVITLLPAASPGGFRQTAHLGVISNHL